MLQGQGFGSRKECRALIKSGCAKILGQVIDDPSHRVAVEDGLEFQVEGEEWTYWEKVYVILHKPVGYECSNRPNSHPSVFQLLPPQLQIRGVQCVGRLDVDTSGLLILTDDGQLSHAVTSPKREKPKVYQATLKYPIDDPLLESLRAGVRLRDAPDEVVAALEAERESEKLLRLTITEGRYHQVRRMVAAAGNRVEGLHRAAVGPLSLGSLPPAAWRFADPAALRAAFL